MTDKEVLDTLDSLLDELSYRKILPNKQYKQIDEAFIYLEKILLENPVPWLIYKPVYIISLIWHAKIIIICVIF